MSFNYNDDLRINKTIQKLMIDENINNLELSRIINKAPATVSKTISQQANPTINTIGDIAQALGYEIKLIFIRKSDNKIIEVE